MTAPDLTLRPLAQPTKPPRRPTHSCLACSIRAARLSPERMVNFTTIARLISTSSIFSALIQRHCVKNSPPVRATAKLDWINTNAKHMQSLWEIEQWSDFQQRRGPTATPKRQATLSRGRGEISFPGTAKIISKPGPIFDLDDYVTFGGKAFLTVRRPYLAADNGA